MTQPELTREEKNLLIYCETRCIDNFASLNQKHISTEDFAILKAWNETGFVKSGRISSGTMPSDGSSYWCELSDEAWLEAHKERKARAKRMSEKRMWKTTEELRSGLTFHIDEADTPADGDEGNQ